MEFETAPSGKPFVRNGPHFSVSSTVGMVACAVSPGIEIGLDIESYLRMSELKMSHSELKSWTEREAVSKATGKGIAQAMDGLRSVGESIYETIHDQTRWSAETLDLKDALATVAAPEFAHLKVRVCAFEFECAQSSAL